MNVAIGLTIVISISIIFYTYLCTKKANKNDAYLVYSQ